MRVARGRIRLEAMVAERVGLAFRLGELVGAFPDRARMAVGNQGQILVAFPELHIQGASRRDKVGNEWVRETGRVPRFANAPHNEGKPQLPRFVPR